MLSENQILDRHVQLNVPLVGRKIVEAIRRGDPSRRVGGGKLNVACRYASQKMGCVIQAESHKNELPAVYVWDHDQETDEFYDQPPPIKLSYRNAAGKKVTYPSTPDYFLIARYWMGWVECKTEQELLALEASGSERFLRNADGTWRCPAGEAYAAQFGFSFKVRSSKETNWILVRNLGFLADYLDAACPAPSPAQVTLIRNCFGDSRWLLLQNLLAQADVEADAVYKMIVDGLLHVDLEQELLTEPNYTTVCVDATSLAAYFGQKKLQVSTPLPDVRAIKLESGTPFFWDGQPWRIVNVGLTEIFVADGRNTVSTLSREIFQTLITQGAILGIETSLQEYHDQAAECVRKAAPGDLEVAVKRYSSLENFESASAKIPARTLRSWRAKLRGGELAYGNGFIGLIPRISARGNRQRKLPEKSITLMNQVIDEHVLVSERSLISIAYGALVNLCEKAGVLLPSEKTFAKEIKRRSEGVVKLAREGARAAYAGTEFCWFIDQSTPRHGERPFEIGHIDHTELDIQLVDSRTGANLGKPWLTILLDAYTRMVLAYFLTFDPPSYRSCMAVIRAALRRHGRIPKSIVVDQGSDFESIFFEVLLARLECHKKSRPAAKSRFGSVIERFFGVNNQRLIHNLAGNNQALQKPRSMSPSHDPRRLAVWTLAAFTSMFERFVDDLYANLQHPALGVSPQEMMDRGLALSGDRSHVLIPYRQELVLQCLPSTRTGKAMVRPGRGVKIRGTLYWHPAFRDSQIVRHYVPVRYDPFDASRAYAYVTGKWLLCRSEYQQIFDRRTENEIQIITQEIRAIHAQCGIRRRVTAADVSSFVLQEKESEPLLRQQRRDAERQLSETASTPLVALPDTLPQDPAPPPSFDEKWATVEFTFENFGELK